MAESTSGGASDTPRSSASEFQLAYVTDVEGEHYRTTGLAPGEYACATPIEYDWCGTDLGGAVGAPWCESGHELVDGVCSQVSPPPPPHTATYTDGDGNTHVWHATKPKIVTGAFQALTLIDMGVDPAQIIGTFGERATSGSNVDGVYANYNIADHGDHAAAPYDPSHFLTDPSPAEKALLARGRGRGRTSRHRPCNDGRRSRAGRSADG